jgi:hypothetical protein
MTTQSYTGLSEITPFHRQAIRCHIQTETAYRLADNDLERESGKSVHKVAREDVRKRIAALRFRRKADATLAQRISAVASYCRFVDLEKQPAGLHPKSRPCKGAANDRR